MRVPRAIALLFGGAVLAVPTAVSMQEAGDDGRSVPAKDWPLVGGDWTSARYSTLSQINTQNIKSLGGAMQGKLWPRNDEERQALLKAGYEIDRVLTADDLVTGDDLFVAATGVTGGALLRGVRVVQGRVETDSIVMRSRSGTFRRIQASHPLSKIQSLTKGAR